MSGWRDRATVVQTAAPAAGGWRSRATPVPTGPASTATEARAMGYLNDAPIIGGYADELTGALGKLLNPEPIKPGPAMGPAGEDAPTAYTIARDAYRKREKQTEAERPDEYIQGQIAGMASSVAVPAGQSLKGAAAIGAGLGGLHALGTSEADLTTGKPGEYLQAGLETAAGGAFGAAGGALGHGLAGVLDKGAQKLAGWAGGKVANANQQLGDLAQEKVLKQLASAAGEVGGEVQKGNRLVENLMRLETSMDPAEQALYKSLQASGALDALKRQLIGSNLADLPGQAGVIEGKQLALSNLQANKGQAFAEALKAVSSPWAQIQPRLVRYAGPLMGAFGLPAVGAGVGLAAGGNPSDVAIGALAGAGLRPAAHAVKRMLLHPSLRLTVFEGMRRLVSVDPATLGKFGPMLATAAARGGESLQALHLALSNTPEYLEQLGAALGLGGEEARQ